jgi:hypothetical protein
VKNNKNNKIEEIIKKSKEINADKVAQEVLSWLITNVENFIDNQAREFKIDLILDSDTMSESTKLQNLYREIPETDDGSTNLDSIENIKIGDFTEVNKCREVLNKITKKCHSSMGKNKILLDILFKRMIFYYEMVGVSHGNVLLKELKGAVSIKLFDYDAFSVNVKLSPVNVGINKNNKNSRGEDNQMITVNISEGKDYDIPEGFTIWLEIAFRDTISRPELF